MLVQKLLRVRENVLTPAPEKALSSPLSV
jgi:hypothetical protein